MTTLSNKLKETNVRQKHGHVACSSRGKKTNKYGRKKRKERTFTDHLTRISESFGKER